MKIFLLKNLIMEVQKYMHYFRLLEETENFCC